MRTKTLLLAAAAVAAGIISSQAQSNVYSANIVGYANLTLKPGYNLVACQFKDALSPTASINVVLTNCPSLSDGSTFLRWDAGLQSYTEAANWVSPASGGPGWYNGDFSDFSAEVAPIGASVFINNAGTADATLTLVGEVSLNNTNAIAANYGFYADPVPTSQEIATNGFPIADGSTLLTWDPAVQSYTEALNGISAASGGPAWYNGDFSAEIKFAPAVGQGFIYNTSASDSWTRNFSVQ